MTVSPSRFRRAALALLALSTFAGQAAAQTAPYTLSAYTPQNVTVLEYESFTPVVRVLDANSVPVGNHQVNWSSTPGTTVTPTSSTTSVSGPSTIGGLASTSFSHYQSGTYTVSAVTDDGFGIILRAPDGGGGKARPQWNTTPVDFTVTVENVGMAYSDPAGGTDTIVSGATRTLSVYWGGPTRPKVGDTINWSITGQPTGGDGALGTATATDAGGISAVDFTATVPGDYTVQAFNGCTWCGPTFQSFTITVTAAPQADVHVIVSDAPDPVAPDGTLTYTIGAGNNGPDAATAVTLSDTLPANTVFASLTAPAGWTCVTPAVGAAGTVTCTHAALASGAADLFDLGVTVTGAPLAGTIITNAVTITAAELDPDSTNNNASTSTTVAAAYGLGVAKALLGYVDNDGSTTVSVGDQLDYEVTATNTGNAGLSGVLVGDDHFVATQSCPALSPGGTCVLAGSYVVTAADELAGQVVNTGSATSAEVPGPVTDSVTTPVVLIPAPALGVNKVLLGFDDNDSTGSVTVGDQLHYEVTASNDGNVALANVLVSDDHFAATQACASVPVAGTCVLTGGYVVTAADATAGQVDNTGSAIADGFATPVTSTISTPVVFIPAPAMTLDKAYTGFDDNDGSTTVTEGDTLHYTVTATNTGNVTLTNLQIDDAQLTPAFTVCAGVSPGGACVLTGTHAVTQPEAVAGVVSNTATAFSSELPGAISSPQVNVPVAGVAGMTFTKTLLGTVDNDASGDVTIGDQLDYDITAVNTGTLVLTNVLISDDHTTATQYCPTLAVGATCQFGVSYLVNVLDASAGQVVNTASVSVDQIPGGMTDSVTTAVVAPPPTLAIVSGDGQAGYGGQTVTLVVELRDGFGNPMAGATIDWTGASFGSTTTGADGRTSNTVTFGGVTATLDVVAAYTPATIEVHFTLQSISAALGIVSGDNQTGLPDTTLPLPLVVAATDDGAPAAAPLSWTVNQGDATVTPTANTTDPSTGEAQATVTLGPTAGPVQVTVVRTDGSGESVVFNLVSGGTRSLLIHDGDFQSGPVGTTLPLNLVVQAQDNTIPVDGVDIAWSVVAGDATVGSCCATTAGGGYAGVSLTFGNTPGNVQVRAERTDDPGVFVVFNATALARTVVVANGDNQSAPTNTPLTDLLVARTELDGLPQTGISLTWAVSAGDASLAVATNPTDAAGNGYAQLTCGATPGPVTVTATRDDYPFATATFSATCLYSRQLLSVQGDGQSAQAGTDFAQTLVVHALDNGVGAPGITVDWLVQSGSATVSSGTTTTDALGLAQVTLTAGATAGPVVVTATRADEPAAEVTFNATVTAPPVLAIVSGNAQTTTVGQEFALDLVVGLTPALAGQPIDWSITAGDGTLTGGVIVATTFTDGAGQARIRYTPSIDGSHQVRAYSAACDCEVLFDLAASPVPPPTLTIISGDGQAGLTSTVADAPLVVELRDGFGNPIAGQGVDFFVSGPGSVAPTSVFTDANGRAQVTLTFGATAGPIVIDVQSAGVFDIVQFNATSLAAMLGIASGDGQSGPVDTLLPLPLEVVVVDPSAAGSKGRLGAQALDGVPVTFAVATGGGSVTQAVVMTDTTGHASTRFTLGPTPGAQTVTATVAGGSSVTFTATAILDRTLVIVSGNGQTAAPGSTLPNPLEVRAQDNGADAAGIAITWSVVSGSATVAPATSTTDTAGLAQTTATLGATPGTVQIRAERADDPTVFVTFAATTAKLQLIPGLDPDELELAIVIDDACAALAGLATLTPDQEDLLARCQELIESSVLDPDATVDALDELLPEVTYALQESAFVAAQAQFQNLKARIAALRSGTQGNAFNGLALTAPGGTVSLGGLVSALAQDGEAGQPAGEIGAGFSRWGFFASGTIGRGEAEEGSMRPAYDYDINGLTVGVDYRKSDTLIFGAALGYTRQDTELVGGRGDMEMSGWSVSGYGTWYRDNSWYTDAVVTWGRNTFDLLRTITYTVPLPGGGASVIDQTARSQSDGDMLEAAFTFGRDFQKGGWSIGPYGRLLYTKLSFDEIHDEMDPGAGSGLGLEIEARTLTSVASEIGAKFTYAHSTDWGVVTPHFQIEWEHEFKDDPKAMTARFLADPNAAPFTLEGEELDTDYFRLSVGLSVILARGRSGFLLYEKTVGRNGIDQDNFGFGIRIEF